MTVFDLFELTNYLAGKFPQGSAITPAKYNLVLGQGTAEFYEANHREIVAARFNRELYNIILSKTPLLPFKKSAVLTAGALGEATLPTDYYDYLTAQTIAFYQGTVGTARVVPIEIVNDELFFAKQNSVTARAKIKPFGMVSGTTMTVVPYDTLDYTLTYLKKQTAPYMDYCSLTSNPTQVVFMPVGSYISPVNNINYLYDSNDNVLASDVIKTMSALPYTSQTVELEWSEQYHHKLTWILLSKLGITIDEQKVVELALAMSK